MCSGIVALRRGRGCSPRWYSSHRSFLWARTPTQDPHSGPPRRATGARLAREASARLVREASARLVIEASVRLVIEASAGLGREASARLVIVYIYSARLVIKASARLVIEASYRG